VLRRIVDRPGGDADRRKASDYYAACMNEPAVDAKGTAGLQPDLALIDRLKSRDELPAIVAHLQTIGVNVLFRFRADTDRKNATTQIADVDQAGLGLPDRDYYLKTDPVSVELRNKYVAHVQQMLGLLGAEPGRAAARVAAVIAFETTLAEASLDRVKRRDPGTTDHQMRLAELQALTPGFDWKRYAAAAAAPSFAKINVDVPDFMKTLDQALASTSVDDLKTYLR
jgi:putative endopeptidase